MDGSGLSLFSSDYELAYRTVPLTPPLPLALPAPLTELLPLPLTLPLALPDYLFCELLWELSPWTVASPRIGPRWLTSAAQPADNDTPSSAASRNLTLFFIVVSSCADF
jgi:hypothetical protein